MDSPLEDKRALHEQRDRLELAIVEDMLDKKAGHKDQLDSQHRQKRLLDKYMACSKRLLELYKSQPIARPANHDNISQACFDFYLNLKKVIQRSSAPDDQEQPLLVEPTITDVVPKNLLELESIDNMKVEASKPNPKTAEKLVEFTDEEGYGRYLDLNKCHEAYLQVIKRDETKPNYLNFLTHFHELHAKLNRDRKLTSAYKKYLEEMLEYFRDYSRRAKPLFDHIDMEEKADQRFLEQWEAKTIPGWFNDNDRLQAQQEISEPMIDLESYDTVQSLMELGLDCLKKELQVRGIKCGGTLEERATRLWSVRGKRLNEVDESLLNSTSISKKLKRKHIIEPKYIASIEAKLLAYAEYYADHRQATIENVQRKQARTADERNESDDDISDAEYEENEQSDVIYNPKNLPLGWDGKPIPYWLYKLHGLNLTYICEICGNATYKGPKTFQRHFAEQRHAHGMKCLGIPNTAHFANITKIQDAISLWEKLKDDKEKDQFQTQNEEEYEDSQGNVVNKKIYEDLKRQGLL